MSYVIIFVFESFTVMKLFHDFKQIQELNNYKSVFEFFKEFKSFVILKSKSDIFNPVFSIKKEEYEKYLGLNELKNRKIARGGDFLVCLTDSEDNSSCEFLKSSFPDKIFHNLNNFQPVNKWLAEIYKADFIITDSYYCLAFALIFNKPFIVTENCDDIENEEINKLLNLLNLKKYKRCFIKELLNKDFCLTYDKKKIQNGLKKIRRKSVMQIYFGRILSFIYSKKEEKYRKIIRILGIKVKVKIKRKQMEENYRAVNYLIAMLKEYGIRNIVSSPGCQNAVFDILVWEDEYFNCFSVTDERSAAYMASGMAEETMEPVVVACTGSTASSNYIPALREAYYRNIPLIAIPFYNRNSNEYNLAAQFVDRSITQKDIKSIQVKLPEVNDDIDKNRIITYLNAALYNAKYNKTPVIIECPSILDFSVLPDIRKIPDDVWKPKYMEKADESCKKELENKKIAVFIGSHHKFTKEEEQKISEFAQSWSAPVFCDHTSNYHGSNKILSSLAVFSKAEHPDLIIDIGMVTGDYFSNLLFDKCKIWRINPKGNFNMRGINPVFKNFVMSENKFFELMKNDKSGTTDYYKNVKMAVDNYKVPELPLCNYLIIDKLTEYIPKNSILHHGVSNTKRGMNLFNFDESVDISCNVGVCGIDGAVSSLVGHSLINPDKKCFGVMGDLTFFYDMNILSNREIKNNLRILLINNNKGIEFKLGGYKIIRDKVDNLIASANHRTYAKGWAQNCGFHYMSSVTKDEFLSQIENFCNNEFDKPVLFEVFTKDEDEIKGLELLLN